MDPTTTAFDATPPPPTIPFLAAGITSPKTGKRREIEIEIEEDIPVTANPLVPDEVVKKYDEVMDEMKRVRGALGRRARRKRLLRIMEDRSGKDEYCYESMTDDGQSICTLDVPFQSDQVQLSPLITGAALSQMPHSTSAPSAKSPFHSPPPIIALTAEPDPRIITTNENQVIGSISPGQTQVYKPPTLPVLSPDSLPTGSVPQTPRSPTTNQRYPLRSPGLSVTTKPRPIPIPIPKVKDYGRLLHPTSPAMPTRSISEFSTARQLFPTSISPVHIDQTPMSATSPIPISVATPSQPVKSPGFFRQIKSKVSRAPLLRRRTLSRRESKAKRNKAKRPIKIKTKLSESEKPKSLASTSHESQSVKTRSSQRYKPLGVLDIDSPYLAIPLLPAEVPVGWYQSQPSTPTVVSGSGGLKKLSVRNFTEGDTVDAVTPTDTMPPRSLPVYSPQHPPIVNQTRSLQLDRRLSKEPYTPTALPSTKTLSAGSTSLVQSPKVSFTRGLSSPVRDSNLKHFPGVPPKISTASLETSRQSTSTIDQRSLSSSLTRSPCRVVPETSSAQTMVYPTGEGDLPKKDMPNDFVTSTIEIPRSLPASPSTLANSQRLPVSPFLMAQSFVELTSLPPAEDDTIVQRRSLDSVSVISVTSDPSSTYPNAVLKHAQLRHRMASPLDPNTFVTAEKNHPSKTVASMISVNDSMTSDHSFGVGSSFGHISTPQSHSSVPGNALLGELSEVQNEEDPAYPSQRIRQRISGPPTHRAFPTPVIPSSSQYKWQGCRSFDGVLNYHGSGPIAKNDTIIPIHTTPPVVSFVSHTRVPPRSSSPTEFNTTSKISDHPQLQLSPTDSQRLWTTAVKPTSLSIVTNLSSEVHTRLNTVDGSPSPSPNSPSDPRHPQSSVISDCLTSSPNDVSSPISSSGLDGSGLGLVHAVVYGRTPWGSDNDKPWLRGKTLKEKFSDSRDAGGKPTIVSSMPEGVSCQTSTVVSKEGQGEESRLQSPGYTLPGVSSPLMRPREPMLVGTGNDCERSSSEPLSSQSSGVLVQETAIADNRHATIFPVVTVEMGKEEIPSVVQAPVLVKDLSRDADLVGHLDTSALPEDNVTEKSLVSSPNTSMEHTQLVRSIPIIESAQPKTLSLSPTVEMNFQESAQPSFSSIRDHLASPVAEGSSPNPDTIQKMLQSLENELDHELTRLNSNEESGPLKDYKRSPLELDSTQQAVVEWIMAAPQHTPEDRLSQNSPLYSTGDNRTSWSSKDVPGSPGIGNGPVARKSRVSPSTSPNDHDKGDRNLSNTVERCSLSAVTSPRVSTATSAWPVSAPTAGESVLSPVRIEVGNENTSQSSPRHNPRWSNSFTGGRSLDPESPSSELGETHHTPNHVGTTFTGPVEAFSPSRSRVSSRASRRTAGQRSRHSILSALSGIMDTLQNDYVEGLLASPSKRPPVGWGDQDGSDSLLEPRNTSHIVNPVPKLSICSRSSREDTSLLLPVCDTARTVPVDPELMEKSPVEPKVSIPVVSPRPESRESQGYGPHGHTSPVVDNMLHTTASSEESLRDFPSVEAVREEERIHIPQSTAHVNHGSDTLTESVHVPYTDIVVPEHPFCSRPSQGNISSSPSDHEIPKRLPVDHGAVHSSGGPTMSIPIASSVQESVKGFYNEPHVSTFPSVGNVIHTVSSGDEPLRNHISMEAVQDGEHSPISQPISRADQGPGALVDFVYVPDTAIIVSDHIFSVQSSPKNTSPSIFCQDLPAAVPSPHSLIHLPEEPTEAIPTASPVRVTVEDRRDGPHAYASPVVDSVVHRTSSHDEPLRNHTLVDIGREECHPIPQLVSRADRGSDPLSNFINAPYTAVVVTEQLSSSGSSQEGTSPPIPVQDLPEGPEMSVPTASPTPEYLGTQRSGHHPLTSPVARKVEAMYPTRVESPQYHSSLVVGQDEGSNEIPMSPIQGSPVWSIQEYPPDKENVIPSELDHLSSLGMMDQYTGTKRQSIHQPTGANGSLMLSPIYEDQAVIHTRHQSIDANPIPEHRAAHEEDVEYSQWQGRSHVRDSIHSFAPTCSISSLELSPCLSPTRFQFQVPQSLLVNSAIDDLPRNEHTDEPEWDPRSDNYPMASPVLHTGYVEDNVIPAELSSSWSPPIPVFATDENYSPVCNRDHNVQISDDSVGPFTTNFPHPGVSDHYEKRESFEHVEHIHPNESSFGSTDSDDGDMDDELATHFEIVAGSSVRSIASVVSRPVMGHSNNMEVVPIRVSPVVKGTTTVASRSYSEDSVGQYSGTRESWPQDLVGLVSPHAQDPLGSHHDIHIPGETSKGPDPSFISAVPVALANYPSNHPEENGATFSPKLSFEKVDSVQPNPVLEQVCPVQIPAVIYNSLSPSSHVMSRYVNSEDKTEQHSAVAEYSQQVTLPSQSSPESDQGLPTFNGIKGSINSPLIKIESVTSIDSPPGPPMDKFATLSQPLSLDNVASVQPSVLPEQISSVEVPKEIYKPMSPSPHLTIGSIRSEVSIEKQSPNTEYSQQVVPQIQSSPGPQQGLRTSGQMNDIPNSSAARFGSVTPIGSHLDFTKGYVATLSRPLSVNSDTSIDSSTSHGRDSSVKIPKEVPDYTLPLSDVSSVDSVGHHSVTAEYSKHNISSVPRVERNPVDLSSIHVQNPAYSPVKTESTAVVASPIVLPEDTGASLSQSLPLDNVTLEQSIPIFPSSHASGKIKSSGDSIRRHLANVEDLQQDAPQAYCSLDSQRNLSVSHRVNGSNHTSPGKMGLVTLANSPSGFPEENGSALLQTSSFENVNSVQPSSVPEQVSSTPVPPPPYTANEEVTSEEDDEDEDLAVVSTVSHVRNPQHFQQPQVYDTIDKLRLDSSHSARSSLSSLGRRSSDKSPVSLQSKSITGMDQQHSSESVSPIPVISPRTIPSVAQIPRKPTPPPKPSARLFFSKIEPHQSVNPSSTVSQKNLLVGGIHDQTKVTSPVMLGRPTLPTAINAEAPHSNLSLLPTPRRSQDHDKPSAQEGHQVGCSTPNSTRSPASPTGLTKMSFGSSKYLLADSALPTSADINPSPKLTAAPTTSCAPALMSVSPTTTSSSVSLEKPIESPVLQESSPSPTPLRSPVQLEKFNSTPNVLLTGSQDRPNSSEIAPPSVNSTSTPTHRPTRTSGKIMVSPQPITSSPSHKQDLTLQSRAMPFRGAVNSPDRRSAILADAWSDMAQEESYAAVLSSQWDKFHPRLSAVVGHSPSAGPSPVLPPSTEGPDDDYSAFESFMTFSFTSEDHGTPGGRRTVSPLGQRDPRPLSITQSPQERKTSIHALLRGIVSENSILARLEKITNPNLASSSPAGVRSSKVLPPVKVGQAGPSPLGTPKTPTSSTWSSLSSWWSKGPTPPKLATLTTTNNLPSRPSPLANSASSSTSGQDPTVSSAPRLQRPMGFRPLYGRRLCDEIMFVKEEQPLPITGSWARVWKTLHTYRIFMFSMDVPMDLDECYVLTSQPSFRFVPMPKSDHSQQNSDSSTLLPEYLSRPPPPMHRTGSSPYHDMQSKRTSRAIPLRRQYSTPAFPERMSGTPLNQSSTMETMENKSYPIAPLSARVSQVPSGLKPTSSFSHAVPDNDQDGTTPKSRAGPVASFSTTIPSVVSLDIENIRRLCEEPQDALSYLTKPELARMVEHLQLTMNAVQLQIHHYHGKTKQLRKQITTNHTMLKGLSEPSPKARLPGEPRRRIVVADSPLESPREMLPSPIPGSLTSPHGSHGSSPSPLRTNFNHAGLPGYSYDLRLSSHSTRSNGVSNPSGSSDRSFMGQPSSRYGKASFQSTHSNEVLTGEDEPLASPGFLSMTSRKSSSSSKSLIRATLSDPATWKPPPQRPIVYLNTPLK
ncbi:hypothetical protein IWQ61_005151 [Dispira simplex]|nr:hypothetical protein IWQ61_005151 [Dispira simplex]